MKLTIGKKLLGLGIGTAVLTLVVGAVGYWGIHAMSGATAKMLREEAQLGQHAARVRANTLGLRRFEKDMFININDPKKVEEYDKKFETQLQHLTERLDALKKVATLDKDRELVNHMQEDLTTYAGGMKAIIARVKSGEIKTAHDGNAAVNQYKDQIHRLEKNAEDFSKDAFVRMDEVEVSLNSKAQSTAWTMGVLGLIAVVAGLALSIGIGRSVTGPLNRMVDMLKDIAEGEGDLTKRLEIRTNDEVGETAHWFNTFVAKVHDIMAEVRDAAASAASAAQQLSGAAEQLASGA